MKVTGGQAWENIYEITHIQKCNNFQNKNKIIAQFQKNNILTMICTTGRVTLAINIFGALLIVTILNAYVIHTKFQDEAERDILCKKNTINSLRKK